MIFLAAAASDAYRLQGAWPTSIQELLARPGAAGRLRGFLKLGANDVWGNPLVFEPFSTSRGYGRIISYGSDGQPGGKGAARDIILNYGENQSVNFSQRSEAPEPIGSLVRVLSRLYHTSKPQPHIANSSISLTNAPSDQERR
ncbi:MAG: Type secretion system protein [Verrucomicrobiota bacterium]